MTVRVSALNSASPTSGTKLLDGEVDIFRTHYSCPGRLPHPEHEEYPLGVCSLEGNDIRVRRSAWVVPVNRTNNVASYEGFNVLFQVLNEELVATGGVSGTVIARVNANSVQLGAITSEDGASEGTLEFVAGLNLTDADIDTMVAPDTWVRVCDFNQGSTTADNVAANGSASASSENSFSLAIFGNDVSASTFWYNNPVLPFGTNDHWWQVELDTPTTIINWELQWYSVGFAGGQVELQGSADGASWTTLDTNTEGYGTGTISGTVASPQSYAYYRFFFPQGTGDATYIAAREFRLFPASPDGITQGSLAKSWMKGGIKMDGGVIDMDGGTITNLGTATNGNMPVTLAQVQTLIAAAGSGGFTLTASRSTPSAPRELTWDDVLAGTGLYEAQRSIDGVTWSTIATVSSGVTTYIDADFLAGDLYYRVRGHEPLSGYFVYSNTVQFSGTLLGAFSCGDYGDGSDGAFSGGNLQAGRLYRFTSFTLSDAITLVGEGETIIQVQNDLILSGAAITLPYTNINKVGTLDVCGETRDVTLSAIAQKFGGAGGNGGQPAIPGNGVGPNGGNGGESSIDRLIAGADGYLNGPGFGLAGLPGTSASPQGQDGGAGVPTGPTGPSTATPGGGGSGGHGMCRGSLIFIVGGDVSIDASTTFIGYGADGGNGGYGGYAPDNNIGVGAAGGGGGGAGGQGGDGGNVLVFHPSASTVSASPILQLQGGSGGGGGNDGPGGTSTASGHPAQTSPSGLAGQPGQDGADGTFELVAV